MVDEQNIRHWKQATIRGRRFISTVRRGQIRGINGEITKRMGKRIEQTASRKKTSILEGAHARLPLVRIFHNYRVGTNRHGKQNDFTSSFGLFDLLLDGNSAVRRKLQIHFTNIYLHYISRTKSRPTSLSKQIRLIGDEI